MARSTWLALALVGLAVVGEAAPQARTLTTNQVIHDVDVATNAETTLVNLTFGSDSLAEDPSGNLYIADSTGVLWDVDGMGPIPVGPTGFTGIGDLDWATGGLWGFDNASTQLFFFDFGSASVTYTQAISGLAGLTVTGVAHRPSDGAVLLSAYGSLNADQLFEVPANATSASLIGGMSHTDGVSYIADIDFDAAGNLYAMTWFHRHFLSVNTTTAATTFVSSGPHRDVTAMALSPVPEPMTMGLLAAGLLAAVRRRKRTG